MSFAEIGLANYHIKADQHKMLNIGRYRSGRSDRCKVYFEPLDGSAVADCSLASLRRRAWAKSRESTWQETQKALTSGPPQGHLTDCPDSNGDPKRTSEEPGLTPNKITSWLDQCRTPLAVSLDDQSTPSGKGAPRNGCSFEDDLSLGAEADHLQSSSKKTGSCGSLAADQKRNQYKEKGRSMNSTGSGKSSTVSSVSELLDLYEEDPEEILLNLGFGRDEPDMSSKIPSRFFNSSSAARGIDIKVYLGAQLQRMEVENPNYALTSRFRQIEVLTTVANQFIQLYGHVSGQPVQSVSSISGSRDQGGGEVAKDQSPPSLFQRRTSAQNVADRLKKSLSKHNLLMASPSPPGRPADKAPPALANGHSGHLYNGHPAQDGDEQHAEKHIRKKDSCSLATVTEECGGSGDGEVEQHTHHRQNGPGDEPESADTTSTNQSADEPRASGAEEKSKTTNPDKALPDKAPPAQEEGPLPSALLTQLRTENADSFDMEEIQSNEDEALLSRTSRSSDLLRTVSQQSDSSGFAEETSSVDASNLKVQESSDSCDSETTVTSHPSQDVATPIALAQPAFNLPDTRAEELEPTSGARATAVSIGSSQKQEKDEKCDENSELVPQYKAHQLPTNILARDERLGGSGPEPQEDPKQEQTQALQDDTQRDLPQLDPPPLDPPPLDPLSWNPPRLDLSSLDPQPLDSLPSDPQPSEPLSSEPLSSNLPSHSPSLDPPPSDHPLSLQTLSPPDHPFCLPTPDSPVLSALSRVKQRLGDVSPRPSRRRHRDGLPLQRSSSLPSSLLSPTRVVSSVKVQLGRGRAFCSQPRYAFRYIQEPNANQKTGDVPTCISTLVIKNTLESDHQDSAPPKAAPRPLMRSSRSLRSTSPPTDWPWITQSVPDLSSNQEQFGHYGQGGTPNPEPDTFLSPSPSHRPETPISVPPVNPSLLYPTPFHPYASLPNLLHPYSNHFPLHQPPMGTPPYYGSLWNLPSGTPPMPHHYAGNYHIAYHSLPHSPPYLGYHGYDLSPFPPLAPDHIVHRGGAPPGPGFHSDLGQDHSPHRGLVNSSHPGHNLGQSPHQGFGNSSHPGHNLGIHPGHNLGLHPVVSQGHSSYNGVGNSLHLGHSLGHSPYLGVGPGHSPYTGHNLPHNPHPGLGPGHSPHPSHSLGPGHSPHLGLSPGSSQVLSGTEMELRRVLHEIRGTVHSLNQQHADTSDVFLEASCQQALEALQQKRRSLGLFRAQMMDLELSIVRQQALVYKHLSPADRLEVEQLESLRSAIREELLELEQQLEDKLMELTQQAAPRKVSDLLREQFLLQSELSYDDHAASSTPSSVPSSRPCSPTSGVGGSQQRPGVYRASITITPVPPPRPDRLRYQQEEEEEGAGDKDKALEEAVAAGLCRDNLHQLITEIRESVTQEVRREIFNELMAATGAPCP
ncbi:protein ITPRID2 isoform X3 [Phyllopteryx taeniolatus]|uniref:protein ITPRID2 isoform X3 n=1 Tax=Phyllopteryx taeniolatus TaxID=161469 RepID=UPI002AD2CF96|nr:protein ITPRID2 isoform X3 [Phyllopteryx taeniolatus]